MLNQLIKKPILSCSIIFVICSVARLIEYFYIRTDETFLSENFLHKLFGILLLWGILSICKLRWKDIGFSPDGIVSGIGKGLLFGLVCAIFAYVVECLTLFFLHGYVILAGMMSIKWSLLYKMTGSLWLGLGDHLFNNLASNLVHVVSNSEADSLQIVRILLWQLLSFATVVWVYKKQAKAIA